MSEEKPFPVLETERLVLRELTRDDAEALRDQYADPEVIEHMTIHPTKTIEDAMEIIDWGKMIRKTGAGVYWGVFDKNNDALLGDINYFGKQDETFEGKIHRADIGYAFSKRYWGKGFASEALQAIIRYTFSNTDIHRLEAVIAPANDRSRNLAKKNGFTEEGTMRDYYYFDNRYLDYMMYSLLKNEWQG